MVDGLGRLCGWTTNVAELAAMQRAQEQYVCGNDSGSSLSFRLDPDRDYSAKVSLYEKYPLTFYAALKKEINEWLDIR